MHEFENLPNDHDLRLPAWGPYTKQYMGISHLSDPSRGLRFDLSLMPGFYRRKIDIPSTLWESGYHPWEATPDFSFFAHRHELEWKDRVYADISFSRIDEMSRLVRVAMVNQTELPQNLVLHWMASLQPPRLPGHGEVHLQAEAQLPAGATWVDALDYSELTFAKPRPSDGLVYDGWIRGEIRGQHFTGGSAVGGKFGADAGDMLHYEAEVKDTLQDGVLLLRYQADLAGALEIRIAGQQYPLCLEPSATLTVAELPIGRLAAGNTAICLQTTGASPIVIDGFTLLERSVCQDVAFATRPWQTEPELLEGPVPNSLILCYADSPCMYGLLWTYSHAEIRQIRNDELDRFARHTVHNHVDAILQGNGKGHFTNVFMRPIELLPASSIILHGMVSSGTLEDVQTALSTFSLDYDECESRYHAEHAKLVPPPSYPSGDRYALSQQLMRATLLTNTVFPVYTKRTYIRHNTPGRWWDSLYTWDSGFIGLGFSDLDTQRAIDCLNAYMTEPGDPQAAFIHHGSPVPVQHYVFHELWNQGQSSAFLHHFYPRLRQYYKFLAGKASSSTTGTLGSGLLQTWDYFYNSGGWDDYPPQKYVHEQALEASVAPVITTSQAIRIAKILKMAAALSDDWRSDIREYEADIQRWTEALDTHAWDEMTGYYGYVVHNEQGEAQGHLRHATGANYNMGLDGLYPLVAGVCDNGRAAQLIDKLFDEDRFWTPIGLTTVDQSAPYYRADGYWNGAVWMPHQWFFWKTMLDFGRPELAYRIADTALELWKRETEATYNCYEHFIVQTGRGAGWHHFGGLSAPVINWFAAYYQRGKVTTGFNVWMLHQDMNADFTAYHAEFHYTGDPEQAFSMLVNLAEDVPYTVVGTGCSVQSTNHAGGGLELTIVDCLPQAAISIHSAETGHLQADL
ncbi:MGH1-like glycoside hydrolase domain-containing protein [Paenibacillus ferrarius]|uniref:MGH1-like glycoside hydrolase domain-containing protein n=1 Tax=Paenibacillus ferrarius TaxID=1469647 RepID=UPI003D28EA79